CQSRTKLGTVRVAAHLRRVSPHVCILPAPPQPPVMRGGGGEELPEGTLPPRLAIIVQPVWIPKRRNERIGFERETHTHTHAHKHTQRDTERRGERGEDRERGRERGTHTQRYRGDGRESHRETQREREGGKERERERESQERKEREKRKKKEAKRRKGIDNGRDGRKGQRKRRREEKVNEIYEWIDTWREGEKGEEGRTQSLASEDSETAQQSTSNLLLHHRIAGLEGRERGRERECMAVKTPKTGQVAMGRTSCIWFASHMAMPSQSRDHQAMPMN
ncbi:Octapeptide-repeat protein T2, partial [Ophiophagus hannah]